MFSQSQNLYLQISEIYASIQGEAAYAGEPCSFVRLTGCPLRCKWCDTVYSFTGGEKLSIDGIVDQLDALGQRLVELTGGEPLAQKNIPVLIQRLKEKGYQVLIETSGSESIAEVVSHCHVIMDIKCPDSKMCEHNRWENIDLLKPSDEVKMVIASRADYEWARMIMSEYHFNKRFRVLLSPAFGLLKPADLASWMLDDRLSAKLNLQQHKFIWSSRARGV